MENEEEEKKREEVKRICETICNTTTCIILIIAIAFITNVGNENTTKMCEAAIKNSNEIAKKELEKIQTELNYYELKIEKLEKGE